MIQELKISAHSVFLEGMSLKGSFNVSNPNELVAISYQIQPIYRKVKFPETEVHQTSDNISSHLTIFPTSGILLKQESQKITIKAKSRQQFESSIFLQSNIKVRVKYTFENNFNKILIKNYRISPIPFQRYKGQTIVNVQVGTDHIRLKDQIQGEVLFGSAIGQQTQNISGIASSPRKQTDLIQQEQTKQMHDIINSLELNSKIKQKLTDSKQVNNLQSPKVFQSNGKNNTQDISLGLQSVKNEPFSVQKNDFTKNSSEFVSMKQAQKTKGVNSFQIIVISICAAFFFSLGSNLNHFLRH